MDKIHCLAGEGRISTSPRKEVKDTCKKTGKQGLSAKGPHQHIIPELSPVRQTSQLHPPLEQVGQKQNMAYIVISLILS